MNLRIAIRILLSSTLLLSAAWLVIPGRNSHGNPSMETLVQSCATREGTIIRLYVGNGGATTAFWYTLTTESGFFFREKQVLFSYGMPEFSAITCGEKSVAVSGTSSSITLTENDLADLRGNPRSYWKGNIKTQWQGWNPLYIIRIVLAGILALAGAVLIRPIVRRLSPRNAPNV